MIAPQENQSKPQRQKMPTALTQEKQDDQQHKQPGLPASPRPLSNPLDNVQHFGLALLYPERKDYGKPTNAGEKVQYGNPESV